MNYPKVITNPLLKKAQPKQEEKPKDHNFSNVERPVSCPAPGLHRPFTGTNSALANRKGLETAMKRN